MNQYANINTREHILIEIHASWSRLFFYSTAKSSKWRRTQFCISWNILQWFISPKSKFPNYSGHEIFFKKCSFLQSTDPTKMQIRNSWKEQHSIFSSVNETAVKTGCLSARWPVTAQRSGVWIGAEENGAGEGPHYCWEGRRAELPTSQLCPGQVPRERISLPAVFPWGTNCNYYHSSLIFNSFY